MKKSLVILIVALFAGAYSAEAQESKSTVKPRYGFAEYEATAFSIKKGIAKLRR